VQKVLKSGRRPVAKGVRGLNKLNRERGFICLGNFWYCAPVYIPPEKFGSHSICKSHSSLTELTRAI